MLQRQIDGERGFARFNCRNHCVVLIDGLSDTSLVQVRLRVKERLTKSGVVDQHPLQTGHQVWIMGHLPDLFMELVVQN